MQLPCLGNFHVSLLPARQTSNYLVCLSRPFRKLASTNLHSVTSQFWFSVPYPKLQWAVRHVHFLFLSLWIPLSTTGSCCVNNNWLTDWMNEWMFSCTSATIKYSSQPWVWMILFNPNKQGMDWVWSKRENSHRLVTKGKYSSSFYFRHPGRASRRWTRNLHI